MSKASNQGSAVEYISAATAQSAAIEYSAVRQFTVGPDVAAVFGFPEHDALTTAQSKTFNIPDFGISTNSGEPVAWVSGQIATATQMTNPTTGAPWVIVFFNYQVTSRDYRTGHGPGEALGLNHGLSFQNSSGGTVFSWGFPYQDFVVGCGWNHQPQSFVIRDTTYVSWFELCTSVVHTVLAGTVYHC
jgi:hypothetical protein